MIWGVILFSFFSHIWRDVDSVGGRGKSFLPFLLFFLCGGLEGRKKGNSLMFLSSSFHFSRAHELYDTKYHY